MDLSASASLVLPLVPFGFDPLPGIRHNSAFAAVLSNRQNPGNAAAFCAAVSESSPQASSAAITVEVKRKPAALLSEDNSSISPSSAKKAKLEEFSMRLPASAQSNICQQRARECLDSQRKLCEKQQQQQQQKNRYNSRYPLPEKPRQKRAVIQDMVRPLKKWLLRHRHNPYPTKAEKVQLALGSNMTLVQVSNWFANARRRLKNVVQENHCSWSKRLRLYNQFVQGNAELLSISSDDSIWNSDEEDSCSPGGNSKRSRKRPLATATTTSEEPATTQGLEDKDNTLEIEESVQYKKTMLQRYLNDAIQVSTSAVTSSPDDESSISNPSKSSSVASSVSTSVTSGVPLARLHWPPLPPPPTVPSYHHPFPWLPSLPASVLHYMNGGSNGILDHHSWPAGPSLPPLIPPSMSHVLPPPPPSAPPASAPPVSVLGNDLESKAASFNEFKPWKW